MSWLYTLVFAGLMFSSGSGSTPLQPKFQGSPVTAEYVKPDETEKFEQTYPLNASGRVSVSNVNGSITVEAWDRNEVKLEYTKTADSKERLAEVEIKIDAKPDYLSVETDRDGWKKDGHGKTWTHDKLTVDFHLMVPRGAALNEIETVNGTITASNFVNLTKISVVNGTVNAANLRGTANLSTVNGDVVADFDRLDAGSKIVLSTVNGHVNLTIPSDSSATINADSLNGDITNDFGLPVRKGKWVGRDLYGRIGSGDARIKLDSVNGALSVAHRNDGKNPSPAVNLLPQKEKDDEDWDKEKDDESLDSAKINKEVAKALKDGTKAAADVQASIKDIQPEIAKITEESVEQAANAAAQTAKVFQSKEFKQAMKQQKEVIAKLADISFSPSAPRIEKKSESFPVKGTPKVTVAAKGCSVTVRGWDKSEVQYRVVQFSDAHNHKSLGITEDHSESSVTIRVADPGESDRVRIEVFVPRRSDLKIEADGEIRLEGVSGDVELTGDDESINVRDVDGNLHIANSDGRIRVIGFRGEIDTETDDGTVNLEGDFQKLKAHANEGSITITLADDAGADIVATNNEISGDGIAVTKLSTEENRSKYKIGKGGASFQIETAGEIHIQGPNSLKSSL